MPRKFLRKWTPDPAKLKEHKHLRFLGDALDIPNLWHFNRRNVAVAFAIGLGCMWIPIPFQSVLAALLAVLFRANLPLSVALVFITNPITMPPMFYGAYLVGEAILGKPEAGFSFEPSLDWLTHEFVQIWKPFLLGVGIVGVLSSVLGYYGIHLLWRLHLLRYLQERRSRRQRPNGQDDNAEDSSDSNA